MFRYLPIVFALPYLISCGLVVSSSPPNATDVGGGEPDQQWNSVPKFVTGCVADRRDFGGMLGCVGVKTIAAIDRASRANSINLLPGVDFVADREILQERTARALVTEEQIENSISTDDNKGSKLIDMLLDSVVKFLQSHSLQFRLPKATSAEMQRALDEGRSKLKKKLLPYLGIFAVKIFALLPVVLGIVGFFAIKALFVGKIALIVAAVLALQKYASGGGGFGGFAKQQPQPDIYGASANSFSPSVANSPAGGYYSRRSVDDKAAAHNLAYNAYSSHGEASS